MAKDKGIGMKGSKPPISTHRAFPAIVATWFAALLGLGSLVVPVALIEQLSVASGLSSVIGAAAPPLGMTARILIALAFALGGGLAGLFIASQVARAHTIEGGEPASRPSGHNPINAHDELGADGFDGNGLYRRMLTADAAPDDELAANPESEFSEPPLDEEDPLELADLAEEPDRLEALMDEPIAIGHPDELLEEEVEWDDAGDREFARPEASDEEEAWLEDGHLHDTHYLEDQRFDAPGGETEAGLTEDDVDQAEDDVDAEEALTFSPPSMTRDVAQEEVPQMDDADHMQPPAARGEDWRQAPLDQLGLVQLAQRLGSSIEQRRETRAARAAQAAARVVERTTPGEFEMAEADEAALAMAAYFGGPESKADTPQPIEDSAPEPETEVPETGIEADTEATAYRSLSGFADLGVDEDDIEEEDDFASSLRIPLPGSRNPQAVEPASAAFAPFEEAQDNDIADSPATESYGSLLGMTPVSSTEAFADDTDSDADEAPRQANGFARRPDAREPDAAENERALREALLNLQRMSGMG